MCVCVCLCVCMLLSEHFNIWTGVASRLRIYLLCELLALTVWHIHAHTHTCTHTHTHSPLPRNIYFSSHISRSPLLTYFLLSKQVKVDHMHCLLLCYCWQTPQNTDWITKKEKHSSVCCLDHQERDKHHSMLTESPLKAERYTPQYADWITREESWWGVGYTHAYYTYYTPKFLYYWYIPNHTLLWVLSCSWMICYILYFM